MRMNFNMRNKILSNSRWMGILPIGIFIGILISMASVKGLEYFCFLLATIGLLLIIILIIFPLDIGLILALISLYNPYYISIYTFQGCENAYIRVIVSTTFILFLLSGILFKINVYQCNFRLKTPLDKPLLLFIFFPFIGTIYGLFCGNELRNILVDIFPMIEFGIFFFITTTIIRTQKQINRLLIAVLLMNMLTNLWEIIIYCIYGQHFYFKTIVMGISIPRLPDFMVAFILPVLISMSFYSISMRSKIFLIISSLLSFIVLWITFFRSLWLGVIIGLIFIFWLLKDIRKMIKSLIILLMIITISFSSINLCKVKTFQGIPVQKLVLARTVHDKGKSEFQRIEQGETVLKKLVNSPYLGMGIGSCFWEVDHVTGKYLFKTDFLNYYLTIAFKMGVISLLFFLYVIFIFFKKGIFIFKSLKIEFYKGLVLGLLSGILSMGIVLMFFASVLRFPIPAYVATTVALVFIIHRINQKEQDEKLPCNDGE